MRTKPGQRERKFLLLPDKMSGTQKYPSVRAKSHCIKETFISLFPLGSKEISLYQPAPLNQLWSDMHCTRCKVTVMLTDKCPLRRSNRLSLKFGELKRLSNKPMRYRDWTCYSVFWGPWRCHVNRTAVGSAALLHKRKQGCQAENAHQYKIPSETQEKK